MLIIFVLIPLIAGLLLRVNAVFLYLSVIAGKIMLMFVGDDAAIAVGGFIRGQNSQLISSMFLLLIPAILTLIFLRGSLPKSQVFLQIPALIATGATLYIFAIPLFTSGIVESVLSSEIGKSVNSSQDLIVASSSLIVLVTMWVINKSHHGNHHKKHKHHKQHL
jgi:hypothetical protein